MSSDTKCHRTTAALRFSSDWHTRDQLATLLNNPASGNNRIADMDATQKST